MPTENLLCALTGALFVCVVYTKFYVCTIHDYHHPRYCGDAGVVFYSCSSYLQL